MPWRTIWIESPIPAAWSLRPSPIVHGPCHLDQVCAPRLSAGFRVYPGLLLRARVCRCRGFRRYPSAGGFRRSAEKEYVPSTPIHSFRWKVSELVDSEVVPSERLKSQWCRLCTSSASILRGGIGCGVFHLQESRVLPLLDPFLHKL